MKNLLLGFGSLTIACLVQADDWPRWHGPEGTGISNEKGWKANLEKIAWKAKLGVGFSTVSVADGRLFTMGHDGKKSGGKETVWCLNATTGKEIWTDSYDAAIVDYLHEGGPCATPTVDGDVVYSISKDGRLNAYLAKTGKILWTKNMMTAAGMKRPPEWGFAASPYALGKWLIIEAGHTFALDKKTGKEIWRSRKYRHAYGSPVAFDHHGKTLIATLKTDGLVILNAENGSTIAFQKWETSYRTNSTTPIINGDKIFVSTGYRRGCALFQFKGGALNLLYENKHLSNHMNNSVLVGDYLYGFDGNVHMAGPKDFVCLKFSSGEPQWRNKSSLQVGSLIVVNNHLIVLGQRGELAIAPASSKEFSPIVREQVIGGRCWTSPVLANGFLYLRNARGDLVCLDLRS